MTKRSSFQNWFYRTWQIMHLNEGGKLATTTAEFKEALEEAYNAGMLKGYLMHKEKVQNEQTPS